MNLWRGRYAQRGIAGLSDQPRPGRPRSVDRAAVIAATLTPPPAKLGVTHWSSRLLGEALGIEHSTVAAIWAEYGVKPWKAETFKFSTDPQLAGKVTDVVGLYLNPPENAIVLCIDEKSQIQALDRTQKLLPMQIGHPEQRTHDYRRHGTATLFAALELATGTVTGLTKNRHRHQEFLVFLKHVALFLTSPGSFCSSSPSGAWRAPATWPLAYSPASHTSTTTAFSRLMSCTAPAAVTVPGPPPPVITGQASMPADISATAINIQLSNKNFTSHLSSTASGHPRF